MIIENLKAGLKRLFSRAPSLVASRMPEYFHTNPRLDPVRVIAKKAANVELKLYSKKDIKKNGYDTATPIEEHELYDLLDDPCPTFPDISGWTLRYLTFAHIRLTGEFFWLKIRATNNHIIALQPIPAAWVPRKPSIGNHTFEIFPWGVTASDSITVAQEDVVWFKDPDLADPYGNGRGGSESIADEIQTDEYAAKYQKNFFFNDASPSMVVIDPNGNQTTAKALKESLSQKVSGFLHGHAPAVLTGRDLKIEKMGSTMQEVDMIETRKFLRDQALQHYQIPPEIYGIIENSNRSTIDAAFYLFNKNVLADDLKFFERVLNRQLLPDYNDDLVCIHDQIIAEDEDEALKIYSEGVTNGCVTRNEFRTRFNLPEVTNGDVFLTPLSTVEVPINEKKPEQTQTDTTNTNDDTNTDDNKDDKTDVLKLDDEKDIDIIDTKIIKTETKQDKIWKLFDTKAAEQEDMFVKQVKRFSGVQRDKVKAAVKTAVKDKADISSIEKALDGQFTDDTDKAVKRSIAPAWTKSMQEGAAHGKVLLGTKAAVDETVNNDLFTKWIEKYGLKKAKEINDTTHKTLRDNLAANLSTSIDNGDSLGNTVKVLMETCDGVYDTLDKTRAVLIARTESATSINFGSMATYQNEGVKKKEWIATRDSRTRPSHLAADGQTVDMSKKFDIGGEMMAYPGDPSASADNVCNCRCTIGPVVED